VSENEGVVLGKSILIAIFVLIYHHFDLIFVKFSLKRDEFALDLAKYLPLGKSMKQGDELFLLFRIRHDLMLYLSKRVDLVAS